MLAREEALRVMMIKDGEKWSGSPDFRIWLIWKEKFSLKE